MKKQFKIDVRNLTQTQKEQCMGTLMALGYSPNMAGNGLADYYSSGFWYQSYGNQHLTLTSEFDQSYFETHSAPEYVYEANVFKPKSRFGNFKMRVPKGAEAAKALEYLLDSGYSVYANKEIYLNAAHWYSGNASKGWLTQTGEINHQHYKDKDLPEFAWNGVAIAPIALAEVFQEPATAAPVAPVPTTESALDVQIGGGHYKDFKIQPVEYIHANNLPFIEGCVVKYITRWRTKNGIQDLKKIKHFVDLLIELEAKQGEHDAV